MLNNSLEKMFCIAGIAMFIKYTRTSNIVERLFSRAKLQPWHLTIKKSVANAFRTTILAIC